MKDVSTYTIRVCAIIAITVNIVFLNVSGILGALFVATPYVIFLTAVRKTDKFSMSLAAVCTLAVMAVLTGFMLPIESDPQAAIGLGVYWIMQLLVSLTFVISYFAINSFASKGT